MYLVYFTRVHLILQCCRLCARGRKHEGRGRPRYFRPGQATLRSERRDNTPTCRVQCKAASIDGSVSHALPARPCEQCRKAFMTCAPHMCFWNHHVLPVPSLTSAGYPPTPLPLASRRLSLPWPSPVRLPRAIYSGVRFQCLGTL